MKADDLGFHIDVIADVLIPPAGDWPAPSDLGVGADLLPRLRRREREAIESAVAALNRNGTLEERAAEERVALMSSFEEREPDCFEALRRCVYYAYYAQPAVIRLLRSRGYDINETPQPRGYQMDPFSVDQVSAVDTQRRVWIPAESVGVKLRTAS